MGRSALEMLEKSVKLSCNLCNKSGMWVTRAGMIFCGGSLSVQLGPITPFAENGGVQTFAKTRSPGISPTTTRHEKRT